MNKTEEEYLDDMNCYICGRMHGYCVCIITKEQEQALRKLGERLREQRDEKN